MEQTKHLPELHQDINTWKTEVKFVRDDVKKLQRRLAEVAAKNTHREVLAQVEHFQNQFIRQLEVADELFHDLKQVENKIEDHIQRNSAAHDHRVLDDHTHVEDRVQTFNRLFNELKSDFDRFLSQCM